MSMSHSHFSSTPLRVAVIYGGRSSEREVSLRSGATVALGLASLGHNVLEVDPADVALSLVDWRDIDVAFIALHGAYGEDGQVQQELENLGVPYTGSGSEASRLAFSKSAAKERFALHQISTPPYVLIHAADSPERTRQQAAVIGYPLVVKPDAQGSSLGVTIVRTPDELPAALAKCFSFESFGLLESYVVGTEWTAGIIDEETLPLIRIGTKRGFFDYQAKYDDDETRYELDFDVSADIVKRIESIAKGACAALGTCGLARVDVMLDRFQKPWVLEVNTVPGMTDHSLVPKAAARRGVPFPQLCDRLVRSCLHGQKVVTIR